MWRKGRPAGDLKVQIELPEVIFNRMSRLSTQGMCSS